MLKTYLFAACIAAGMCVLAAGCDPETAVKGAGERMVIPPGVAGTVAECADLVGSNEMLVKGYGLVVGLGDKGSSEVPSSLRQYIVKEMFRRGVASATLGTTLSPDTMLADKDTAVVVVGGWVPPGAPVGTRFDLYVETPPQTQTLSLDGGYVLPLDLRFALAGTMATFSRSKPWGEGKGAVFVNPFVARSSPSDLSKLRSGTIPNGSVVTRERPLRLELRRPDYRMADLIQRRINERFVAGDRGEKVAVAESPSIVNLHIPHVWRRDYRHFLELLMHVHLMSGPGDEELHARQLARAIELPEARHNDIALVWEAMGRQVLPVIRQLYLSPDAAAAFYSSRTGLRLEDAMAVDPMIRIARHANSSFQVQAAEALGEARGFIQVVGALKGLLSSRNELLRVAAYEALVAHRSGAVRRTNISDQFVLDVVDTEQDYTIYATQTGEPKIVLFGKGMPVRRPVFYCPPDELVTVNDSPKTDTKPVMVYRKLPWAERRSDPLFVDAQVADLVAILGRAPHMGVDDQIEGLGLSYSQVLGVLQGMCEQGHIPAKFVLQRSDEVRRIYSSTRAVGRPDMPTEDEE